MNRFIVIGSMIMLGITAAACDTASRPADVRRDVGNAETARSANVAEARKDGAQAIQQERRDVSAERRDVSDAKDTRNYEVALAKAEGDYKIATETCNGLAGSAQVNCKAEATAALESDKARAEMLKPKA
jgi:hypothetical protein